jgi:hypothetical protein
MTTDGGDRSLGAPRFDVVLRGYDRRQVDEHVARLQRVLARMRADLELARSQPIPVVPPAGDAPGGRPRPAPRPRPGTPGGDPPDMIGSFTDRMQSILQAAEEEAAEIRNQARTAARADEERVRAHLADLIRQRDAVLAELTRLRGQLEGLLSGPTARITLPARESGSPPAGRPREMPPGPPLPGTPHPGVSSPAGSAQHGPAQPGSAQPGPAQPGPAQPGSAGPRGKDGADGAAAPSGAEPGLRPRPSAGPRPGPGGRPSPRPEPGSSDRGGSEPGGAAHRAATGATPTVGDRASSMRPRSEPPPEPGELFRPSAEGAGRGGEGTADPQTTAVPRQPAPGGASGADEEGSQSGPDRTAVVQSVRPAAEGKPESPGAGRPVAQDTVKVSAVRPSDPGSDATRMTPTVTSGATRSPRSDPPGGEGDQEADGRTGAPPGGEDGPNRTRSTSHSR